MPDIQVSDLPLDPTLDDEDFVHLKSIGDGIDYKVSGAILKDSKNVSFNNSRTTLVATNVQDALDEIGGPGTSGGYYVPIDGPVIEYIGPNGDHQSVNIAMRHYARKVSGEFRNERYGVSESGNSLVTLVLMSDYIWDEEVTVTGGVTYQHVTLATPQSTTIQTLNITGHALRVEQGSIGPNMCANIDMSGAAGGILVTGVGSKLHMGLRHPVPSTPGGVVTDLNIYPQLVRDGRVTVEKGATLRLTNKYGQSATSPAIVFDGTSGGLTLDRGAKLITSQLPALPGRLGNLQFTSSADMKVFNSSRATTGILDFSSTTKPGATLEVSGHSNLGCLELSMSKSGAGVVVAGGSVLVADIIDINSGSGGVSLEVINGSTVSGGVSRLSGSYPLVVSGLSSVSLESMGTPTLFEAKIGTKEPIRVEDLSNLTLPGSPINLVTSNAIDVLVKNSSSVSIAAGTTFTASQALGVLTVSGVIQEL